MDSKAVNDVDTKVKGRKTNVTFPISFLDFLNSKTVDKISAKSNYANNQSKGLITQVDLKNDTMNTFNSLVDENAFSKNICDDNQSKDVITQGCMDNDKESSDLEDVTLSDDEDFLPTYKSLFERIKRHSSEDNLFKCSPGSTKPNGKVKNTVFDNSITSVSHSEINCESSVDDEIKSGPVMQAKFESLNTSEASQSALEAVSKTATNVVWAETQRFEHFANEDKLSINKDKELIVPPVEQPTSLLVTDANQVHKSDGGRNQAVEMKVEHFGNEDKSSINKLKHLVVSQEEQPASLLVTDASQVHKSDGGRNEGQEELETLPEICIADLERICYKAMIFQQTGQVPSHCDSDTTECYTSCEGLDPKLKNPCPCLCRFYCKKKCKKNQAKLSSKGPCRLGKGYSSDKRNQRHSSCACKILPCSKVAQQMFRTEIGESSNIKSVGTYEIDIGKTNTVSKTKFKNQKRTRTIEEQNAHDNIVTKYLDDLAAKTKLLAKLEVSERRLKCLANYDASLPVPLFSGMVPVDEDGICDASVLSLSDDDSVEQQKENMTNISQTRSLGLVIDLTADSPPMSSAFSDPYKFNQAIVKADPEGEMSLETNSRRKPTVGRYGVAMGAIYTSDSSDGEDILNGYTKDKERGSKLSEYSCTRKLSKEPIQNSQKSIHIYDSVEDSTSRVLPKTSVLTTHSTKSPNTSVLIPVTQNPRNSLVNIASNLNNKSLATESNNSISIAGYHSSVSVQNSAHKKILESDRISRLERIDTSKDRWSYHPVTSGSKDTSPVPEKYSTPNSASTIYHSPIAEPQASVHDFGYRDFINNNTENVPRSIINDSASTSHSELHWETPSSNQGTTYADLLASYAAYDSDDDDRMSFTMGSPESSECLVNEGPSSPIKIVESEKDATVVEVVKMDDVFIPLPSTSATPAISLPSNRVLRVRTTPRITQTMMFAKRTVKREKKEVDRTTLTPSSVHNVSASQQSVIPTSKQRGRRRKKPCQQVLDAMDDAMKKAKVATASVDDNDESTPDRAKLREKITAMESQLKKVSAMAARAAQLEKLAIDAKQKEFLAVQMAQEASAKLKAERLERLKLLKETKEKNRVEKERQAKELEKEKEKAASEARAKAWECPVCFEPRSATMQLSVTPCGHLFCKPCILEVAHSNGHCPLCNHVFTEAQVSPLFFSFPC